MAARDLQASQDASRMAADVTRQVSGGWLGALEALAAELDTAEALLDLDDDGWGPEDVPVPVALPLGDAWTTEERQLGAQLLDRIEAVTARTEDALAALAADLGELRRRRGAARAYGGRWQMDAKQRSSQAGDPPKVTP
jgi:hypothetical protein